MPETPELRDAAEVLDSMEYEVQNASGPYALRVVCEKLYGVLSIVVDHLRAAPESHVPAPPIIRTSPLSPAQPPIPVSTPRSFLPGRFANLRSPHSAISAPPDLSGVPLQAGVANVVISATGTQVISPSGTRTSLAPGEAVPLEATSDIPPTPPPAPEGVTQVVLPPGGGALPPELTAALATRSNEPPPNQ